MKQTACNENISLVASALLKPENQKPIFSIPDDKSYVYSVSSFPPPSTFIISVTYPALIIPARRTAELRKALKNALLQRAKTKLVYALSEKDPLPPEKEPSMVDNTKRRKMFRKMLLIDRKGIYEQPEVENLLNTGEFAKSSHTVTTTYADWTVDEVLRLGKVLLDKNAPKIKTVVNKVGNIETEFRTFGMEVIAGNEDEGWSEVTVKEEGCRYALDFRKVYWNSRLVGEHRRLVNLIQEDSESKGRKVVVADFMAGIGPFAVPLTAKGNNVEVHANDLNPFSYKYLVLNREKNKCKNLKCYNMCARAFSHHLQDEGVEIDHVIMNLPASAPEFLDALRGFSGKRLPRIHVHCFGPKGAGSAENDLLIERCSKALGHVLRKEEDELSIHSVRDIAPSKNMYCVSFSLPESVRDLHRIEILPQNDEPDTKRKRLNDDDNN